jgi:hypothetical protein
VIALEHLIESLPLWSKLSMIKSAYLGMSVFGGYFEEDFSENTVPFFERILG